MRSIYVVRDTLAQEYVGQPLFFPHDAAAARFFSDAVRDEKTFIAKYPQDHALWRIGSIDAETGACVCEAQPVTVVTGAAVLALAGPRLEAAG